MEHGSDHFFSQMYPLLSPGSRGRLYHKHRQYGTILTRIILQSWPGFVQLWSWTSICWLPSVEQTPDSKPFDGGTKHLQSSAKQLPNSRTAMLCEEHTLALVLCLAGIWYLFVPSKFPVKGFGYIRMQFCRRSYNRLPLLQRLRLQLCRGSLSWENPDQCGTLP